MVFDKIVQEVNSMKPDAIIVTGDITDEGILPQFELARIELQRLNCRELIVLPGNHDYRHGIFIVQEILSNEPNLRYGGRGTNDPSYCETR